MVNEIAVLCPTPRVDTGNLVLNGDVGQPVYGNSSPNPKKVAQKLDFG